MNHPCVPSKSRSALVLLAVAILAPSVCHGVPASFELDLKELERQKPAIPRKNTPAKHRGARGTTSHPLPGEPYDGPVVRYTVKSGDHIFRILMKEFGLSNDEAERLIPTVARINKIDNIRKLAVGQTLLIPTPTGTEKAFHGRRAAAKHVAPPAPSSTGPASVHAEELTPVQETPPHDMTTEMPAAPPSHEPTPTSQPSSAQPVKFQPPPAPRNVTPLPAKNLQIVAQTPEQMVDALLKALGVDYQKMKIVDYNGGAAAATSFSIKVDRYIQENGTRIIINCTPKDQFNYTLLRLLENEGYRVVLAEGRDFKEVAGAVLTQLGRENAYVVRKVHGKDVEGYLVGDGKEDLQLFISESSPVR